ncbi:unnamed protein product [Rotaria magnacalcarata]|uniref:DUF4550 domain-containing protein n=1 Tax=Rotaria magnacalcarata TaxID=392030 RepID=A0A8S2P1Y9_9BILA|nr:unnamed protein product [Rotaria magnacalcarata]
MNLSAIEEASSLSSNFQKTLISNVSIDKSTTESSCPNTNHVKIRFTIALAVPADSQVSNESESPLPNTYYSGRVSDASKAQTYYRVEYSLIPGEPNVAFDIVVFRTAAKIYPDNQDSRVVLTWEDENENVWIVWNHVHKVDLSRERLLALLSHKIFVKIWDGKEYCNVRTKLDKPRIGRALQTLTAANKNGDQDNSPKHIVQSMAQNFADKWVAKPMLYKLHRKLPISIPPPTTFLQKKIDYTENPRLATPSVPNVLQEKSSDNSAKESSTHIEGSISTPTKNENPIIVKSSPDENEAKPNDNIKQKKGLLVFFVLF